MEDCGVVGRTILVALDESEHSFHALQWLLQTLVTPTSSPLDKLILLHVNTLSATPASPIHVTSRARLPRHLLLRQIFTLFNTETDNHDNK